MSVSIFIVILESTFEYLSDVNRTINQRLYSMLLNIKTQIQFLSSKKLLKEWTKQYHEYYRLLYMKLYTILLIFVLFFSLHSESIFFSPSSSFICFVPFCTSENTSFEIISLQNWISFTHTHKQTTEKKNVHREEVGGCCCWFFFSLRFFNRNYNNHSNNFQKIKTMKKRMFVSHFNSIFVFYSMENSSYLLKLPTTTTTKPTKITERKI